MTADVCSLYSSERHAVPVLKTHSFIYSPLSMLSLTIRASSTSSLFKASIKTYFFLRLTHNLVLFLCISSMLGVVVFWDIAGYDIFDYYRF